METEKSTNEVIAEHLRGEGLTVEIENTGGGIYIPTVHGATHYAMVTWEEGDLDDDGVKSYSVGIYENENEGPEAHFSWMPLEELEGFISTFLNLEDGGFTPTSESVDYVIGAVLAQMEDLPLHKKQEVLADIIADLFPKDYVVLRSGEGSEFTYSILQRPLCVSLWWSDGLVNEFQENFCDLAHAENRLKELEGLDFSDGEMLSPHFFI